ncbi:hypothetical protein IT779_23780 [Nocardia sp. NEAU-351]|uniref:Uncharacterized protein n=1 Tax=Nocardia bovistercoris TaxID=2785916 RepID=A0A931ID92_9NOCA|nr:hypothetical protein [Nocardia bovistercoris]
MRYRLDVVAHNVADAVEHAGGWLFDRVGAGWEVTVLIPGLPTADVRPLRILGAEVLDLDSVIAARGQGRRPDAVAISSVVCEQDSRTHRGLLNALHDGGVEVVVWGRAWTSPPQHQVDPVVHRLSIAAQAFKAQALTAAQLPQALNTPTEVFRSGLPSFPPLGFDLVPVG